MLIWLFRIFSASVCSDCIFWGHWSMLGSAWWLGWICRLHYCFRGSKVFTWGLYSTNGSFFLIIFTWGVCHWYLEKLLSFWCWLWIRLLYSKFIRSKRKNEKQNNGKMHKQNYIAAGRETKKKNIKMSFPKKKKEEASAFSFPAKGLGSWHCGDSALSHLSPTKYPSSLW